MYYTREQHKRFLDRELQAISENYIRVLNTKATALLSENEIYVAQFMKVDLEKDTTQEDKYNGSGQIILKFKKDKGIPRKMSILLRYYSMVINVFPKTGVIFHGLNYVNFK